MFSGIYEFPLWFALQVIFSSYLTLFFSPAVLSYKISIAESNPYLTEVILPKATENLMLLRNSASLYTLKIIFSQSI